MGGGNDEREQTLNQLLKSARTFIDFQLNQMKDHDQLNTPNDRVNAARHLLDQAGLHNVSIEQVPGHLSDHYDPRAKVLRLSQAVYNDRSLAASSVGRKRNGERGSHCIIGDWGNQTKTNVSARCLSALVWCTIKLWHC